MERTRRVLVVEDDPAARKLIALALESRHLVETADGAVAFRAALAAGPPDLLILDVRLEAANGLDLLAEFRQTSLAPVLLITGHGSEGVAARALELRANAYLAKPFDLTVLRDKAASLLAEGPRPEHMAERACILIEEICARPVGADDIARELGVGTRQLTEAFRERFGQTPMQYLREVRIRKAEHLLLTTDLGVAEAAARTGFSSLSYFDRYYKRSRGMTPIEFRNRYLPLTP